MFGHGGGAGALDLGGLSPAAMMMTAARRRGLGGRDVEVMVMVKDMDVVGGRRELP